MSKQRYFITLSYRGTQYSGWQVQPNAPSVQATLDAALSTILRQAISITGCGRTDAGVHARYFVAHFDAEHDLPPTFLNGLNSILPEDIAVYTVQPVSDEAHTRYDAFERSYTYHITFRKDPFLTETAWFYPQFRHLDLDKMDDTAHLLTQFSEFFPFCKTNSGVDNYHCSMKRAVWERLPNGEGLLFHITANRFLRGMVRLIVGACVQTAMGQLKVEEIANALKTQSPLPKSLSAPAHGLFLTDVQYPSAIFTPATVLIQEP